MIDLESIHDEVRQIGEDTDANREVRLTLQSIERSLSKMVADEDEPKADRLKEVRAELDRLADDASGETAVQIDRVRDLVREFERTET